MDGHVDWLSWTMRPDRQPENIQELYHIAKRALRSISDEHEFFIFDGQGFDREARQAFYRVCLAREDNGVRVAGGGPAGTLLFEASGRACDAIIEPDLSRRIVGGVVDNITRFDYAVDIRDDTVPAAFANSRQHLAFRTISFIRSDTGETVYVGSPKSDRFARVYRYNPPHPRHHILRIEHVFRRGLAKAAALQYTNAKDPQAFVVALGNTWGWQHPVWQPGVISAERVFTPSVSREDEDTITWLYKQVAPAVRRTMKSGALDIAHWLEYIYEQHGR